MLGTTKSLGVGKGANVYLYSKAFTSAERLYLVMGHEYIHVAHLDAKLFSGIWSEHAALRWQTDQAKAFGILPYNKTWAHKLLNSKYYNASYDYKKFAINPIVNFLW